MKIKYEIDNDCVGCEYCVHCGRGDYRVPIAVVCDSCGEDQEEVYDTPDGYFCKDCLTEVFNKISVEDIAEDDTAFDDEDWEKV